MTFPRAAEVLTLHTPNAMLNTSSKLVAHGAPEEIEAYATRSSQLLSTKPMFALGVACVGDA
jgi:hypothetical protein